MARITTLPDLQSFECAPGDSILRAALRAGIGMPYSCNVGSCGNCRFELVEGSVTHDREDPPAWSERDLKRNRWLGCQALPGGDCTIKFRAESRYAVQPVPAMRTAELLSVRAITRDISEFTFRPEGDDAFHAGQYALIGAPGITGARAYSMANLPGTGLWQFQIKRVPGGALTKHLFDIAKPGDQLTIDGPYGTAFLQTDIQRDLVLMAGGSGLSPMMSILRGAVAAGMTAERKIHFYYGCRNSADLFDASEIEVLAPAVTFTAVLSETEPNWTGRTGFLHDAVAADLGADLPAHEIYFAGPAVMSAAIQKMAHEAGTPMSQLHFDEFY